MIGNEELQIALWNQIDATGYKVYTYLPSAAPYPFVNLGEEFLIDAKTKDKTRYLISHTVHTWSQSKLKSEINSMNSKVIEALKQPFPLGSGFYMSKTELESATVLLDPDVERLWHGNLQFTFTISKG